MYALTHLLVPSLLQSLRHELLKILSDEMDARIRIIHNEIQSLGVDSCSSGSDCGSVSSLILCGIAILLLSGRCSGVSNSAGVRSHAGICRLGEILTLKGAKITKAQQLK